MMKNSTMTNYKVLLQKKYDIDTNRLYVNDSNDAPISPLI